MKLPSTALLLVTLAPPVFGGMVTGKPKSTHLFYKIKSRFNSIHYGFRKLEEEGDDCCCCDTNDDSNSNPNSPSTSTPTTSSMPSGEPTTRLEAINSAMLNIYTALGTTTVDLTGTTYCTWTGVTCDSDNIEPTVIDLEREFLTGYLATDIGMITDLTEIRLRDNDLTGGIPIELNNNVNLLGLYLGGNQLTGVLPELSGLSALTSLELYNNQLTGSVPDFSGLAALNRLNLLGNNLSSSIPDSSSFPSTLESLYLDVNDLTGVLPDLSSLSLEDFDIYNNLFDEQSLPDWLFDIGFFIDVSDNQFTGVIPASMGNSNAKIVYLAGNQLTGPIPIEISGMTNTFQFSVADNALTGEIPGGVNNMDMDYYNPFGGFFFSVRNNAAMTGTAPSALCAEDYFHYEGTSVTCASG